MYQLVLASQSPRRRQLLDQAGFLFQVHSIEISEILNENLSLTEQIEDLARRKAEAVLQSGILSDFKPFVLLSADTVVELFGKVLGKPASLDESRAHVSALSGNTHRVITAVSLWSSEEKRFSISHETAEVEFRKLTDSEIDAYVQTQEGMDKAGAYGAQGLGRGLIKEIRGNLDTVMGLPVRLVENLLQREGWNVYRR